EVAAGFPVRGQRRSGGPRDESLQSLLRRGIAPVVEAVELQRLHQARDILLRGDEPRLVGTAHDPRHDERGEYAENDDDHHYFEQRESALATRCGDVPGMHCCRLAHGFAALRTGGRRAQQGDEPLPAIVPGGPPCAAERGYYTDSTRGCRSQAVARGLKLAGTR